MTRTYRVTIERTETTILEVEADSFADAEITAWKKWAADSYGIAETNITEIEELEQ